MKDERGLYYYPFPQNRKIRMYVRRVGHDVCFRLWDASDDSLWEEHGWVPFGAIREASSVYTRSGSFDPSRAYDIVVANELLREEGQRL